MREELFGAVPTCGKDPKRIASSVSVVILIERIIPPTPILLLLGEHDLRLMLIINRPVGFWKKSNAVHRVIVAIKIEIAGVRKMGGVGHWPFTSDIDPTVANDQTIKPNLQDFVRRARVTPDPSGRVASRRATERTAWTVDTISRPVTVVI